MTQKPNKQRPILIGAAIIAVISSLPGISIVNCCCCAGILFGGAFAVYQYKNEFTPDSPEFETSDAMIIGLLSGLGGAIGATILSALFLLTFGPLEAEMLGSFLGRILENLEANGSLPPETAEMIMERLEESMSSSGTFVGIMMALLFNIILFPVFGMLGSLIGYGIFRRKPGAPVSPAP